mmetsp:Transcript_27917/g.47455  ORF Transcript_27917/g.47455 Transcript_27917/m.47455 type:complete len:411 (-) Transcript_27917:342-1574(-)
MSHRFNDTKPYSRVSRSDPLITASGTPDKSYLSRAEIRISAHTEDEMICPQKMRRLPATAEEFYRKKLEKFGWKGKPEVLLAGTRDGNSPLSLLREHEATIVREICSFISNRWARHVKLTVPAALVGVDLHDDELVQFNHGRYQNGAGLLIIGDYKGGSNKTSSGFDNGFVAWARCCHHFLNFPEPAGRNVNMMPFIFGDKHSLPNDLQCYFPLIERCPYMQDDVGKVGYLTVHESHVNVGDAQRREGLHIESPGVFCDSSFTPAVEHHWGAGFYGTEIDGGIFMGPDRFDGGIFMASSVKDTSIVWDALVDSRIPGIVDQHGGCKQLRSLIGKGTKLEAGELIWMTDCTPHEALPQEESGFRQFFRVVTPNISHWYADHSTANPNVPLPSNVTVVHGNKFTGLMSDLHI